MFLGRVAIFVAMPLLCVACYTTENSVSSDEARFGVSTGKPVTLFEKFTAVVQSNCVECHNASGEDGNFDLATEQEWISSPDEWIVPGDPENSYLLQQLQQNGGEMPKDHAPISQADYEAMRAWIASLPPSSR